jgi:ABC-type uncharacterized transport system fused permease/ATPase subunit
MEEGLQRLSGFVSYAYAADPSYLEKLRAKFGTTVIDSFLHKSAMKSLRVSLESIQHVVSLTLDLDLSAPGLICLVGRNGTGKTTLVRALRNLLVLTLLLRRQHPMRSLPTAELPIS